MEFVSAKKKYEALRCRVSVKNFFLEGQMERKRRRKVEEESCDTKEPEKRRLIGREENVEKKGKGKEGGFGRFGADILH